MQHGVFISYRRSDTAAVTGRLFDVLEARFGDQVFMDVVTIRPGVNFVDEIRSALSSCSTMIVLIGARWLPASSARDRGGEDFVRLEIAAALEMGVPLVPVLIDGAHLPSESELPEDLRRLAHIESMHVRQASFDQDAAELCNTLLARAGVPAFTKVDAFLERFKIAGIQKLDERMLRIFALGSMGMNAVTSLGIFQGDWVTSVSVAALTIVYAYLGRRSVKYGVWAIRALWIAVGLIVLQAALAGYAWFLPRRGSA